MREEIIKTSLQQFLKNGIRKMTIQNLVAPQGISTKTVYKYFHNKEELLRECLSVHYARLLDEAILTGDSYPNVVIALENSWKQAIDTDFGVNQAFYHDLNYYYPSLQDEILKKYGKKISVTFIKLIELGIKEGYFRKNLNPPVVFEAMTVIYSSLTRTEQFKRFRLTPAELARHTILVYLRGICTENGLKEIKLSE